LHSLIDLVILALLAPKRAYAAPGEVLKVSINRFNVVVLALLITHFKIALESLHFKVNNKHKINNNWNIIKK
jgi:hypothetical protein